MATCGAAQQGFTADQLVLKCLSTCLFVLLPTCLASVGCLGLSLTGGVLQVRGAYVKLERARAARLGYESPIWDTIEQTHINYDQCLDAVLDEVGLAGWSTGQ